MCMGILRQAGQRPGRALSTGAWGVLRLELGGEVQGSGKGEKLSSRSSCPWWGYVTEEG